MRTLARAVGMFVVPVVSIAVQMGCGGEPSSDDRRSEPSSDGELDATGDSAGGTASETSTASDRDAWLALRQLALPEPAVWVEAFSGGRQCGAIWFDETRHVLWSVDEAPRWDGLAEYPLGSSFHDYRDEAYRREPSWLGVKCRVVSAGELTCEPDPCTNPVRTQPPPECRNAVGRARTRGVVVTTVQRTREFVPARPWWRSGLLHGGRAHTCLRRGESLQCYRLDADPALRAVDSPALNELGGTRDISAGGSTACAVTMAGDVYCWGTPLEPAPEEPTEVDDTDVRAAWTPRRVAIESAVQVSVGLRTACARTTDGRVFCWGDPNCFASEPSGSPSPPAAPAAASP